MSDTTIYVGVKGGVGTSTVAAIHVTKAGLDETNVQDLTGTGDMLAMFGVPTNVEPNSTESAVTVVDAGTDLREANRQRNAGRGRLVVVTDNTYNGLRHLQRAMGYGPDMVMLVHRPALPLTVSDVGQLVGDVPMVVTEWSSAVARAADAGLFGARPDRTVDKIAHQIG